MAGVALSFVLAIVTGISGLLAPGGGAALAASTTLTIIDGEVLVSRAGGPFEVAQDGAVIGRGDVIRTAVGGRAVLTYFEGSTVAIEPSSELAIDEAHASPDGSSVVVMTQNLGRTWHVVTRLIGGASSYEVRTPAATASVRGTAFEVGVERGAGGLVTTRVFTTEGLVAAAAPPTPADPQPEPVVIAAGFQTNARSSERKPEAPTLAPEPERKVTVTIGDPSSLVIDPLGRANGYKDGKLVLQTPGAQVLRLAGTLQITLPGLPDGKLSTVVQRRADGTGTPIDVPVITRVRENGKSTLHEDTVPAGEAVSGVEVKRGGSGAEAMPELRRVTEEEKKDLKKPKVAAAPTTSVRTGSLRPGLGDPRVLSNSVEQRRADPPGAAAGGPGFVQSLPFPNAPNPGTQQRDEARRQDEDKKAELDASAAEQLQKAAERAGNAAEEAQENAQSGQQRANDDRSRASAALEAAEAARQRALEQAAQAHDGAKRREAEDAARRAEADKEAAKEAQRKADQLASQKREEAARAAGAKKAAEELAKRAQEEAERLRGGKPPAVERPAVERPAVERPVQERPERRGPLNR